MDMNWRPPLHIIASIIVVTLIAATLFDGALVKCPVISPPTAANINYYITHTGINAVSGTDLNAFSQPQSFSYLSYEQLTTLSSDLILHAKISFVLEIIAGFLIQFTIIGALAQSTISVRMIQIMAFIAVMSTIIAAVFDSLLVSDAGKIEPSDLASFNLMSVNATAQTTLGTCTIAKAGIFAWIAAGLWLMIFLDGWRSMRKQTQK